MNEVRIIFKNGKILTIKCENFIVTRSELTNEITKMSWKGVTDNKPLYIDLSEVMCVYQVLTNNEVEQ